MNRYDEKGETLFYFLGNHDDFSFRKEIKGKKYHLNFLPQTRDEYYNTVIQLRFSSFPIFHFSIPLVSF